MNNFRNEGFGWVCLGCARETRTEANAEWRLMSEGESESKRPELSSRALARWADPERTALVCPRCGTREERR